MNDSQDLRSIGRLPKELTFRPRRRHRNSGKNGTVNAKTVQDLVIRDIAE